ncbi:hypothetical protein GA0115254_10846 [Streptomyces sp. Ncost-T10-10d]|nr:hypothetical protein GA0115254_10846 [Streptomyces sp. Ncost-T10-10d]
MFIGWDRATETHDVGVMDNPGTRVDRREPAHTEQDIESTADDTLLAAQRLTEGTHASSLRSARSTSSIRATVTTKITTEMAEA